MASGGRLAGRQRLWLAGAEKDWRDYLDVILGRISNTCEMASVNTNTALYEADPAPLASTRALHHLRNAARDPALSSAPNSVDMPRQGGRPGNGRDQMGLISSRLRPVVRGPISAIRAIVAPRAATTTVNIVAAP
jgi:hypothetical protein